MDRARPHPSPWLMELSAQRLRSRAANPGQVHRGLTVCSQPAEMWQVKPCAKSSKLHSKLYSSSRYAQCNTEATRLDPFSALRSTETLPCGAVNIVLEQACLLRGTQQDTAS